MIGIRPATAEDCQHLAECLALDEWHKTETPEQWTQCQGGLITFFDEKGPIFHMAFEDELEETLRVHCQFDPRERRRTALGLLDAFNKVTATAKQSGKKRIVFKSESPKLIAFLERLGFAPCLGTDDFELKFEE